MLQWEYLTVILDADRSDIKNSKGPTYDPSALMPQLNAYGAQGWELISAHPYLFGANADVRLGFSGTMESRYSHAYLCVFKRQLMPAPPRPPLPTR